MLIGHGGNIHEVARKFGFAIEEIIDLSSNLNPLGPPPGLLAYVSEHMDAITALPEVDAGHLIRQMARKMDMDPGRFAAAGGTTQFIYALPRVLGLRNALIVGPTYADYADACALAQCRTDYLMCTADDHFNPDLHRLASLAPQYQAVFICNPNNPTGAHIPVARVAELCRNAPDTLFIVDESYLPFHENATAESCIPLQMPNVVILNSMSKIYRIPGLRIGFMIAAPNIIKQIRPHILPWSVNSLACAAMDFIMDNDARLVEFTETARQYIKTAKSRFLELFKTVNAIKLFIGEGPFILARLAPNLTAAQICEELARQRLLIRNCDNFTGLTRQDIRFSFKSLEINDKLAETLIRAITRV